MGLLIYLIGCVMSFILLNIHLKLIERKYDHRILPKTGSGAYTVGIVFCTSISWLGVAFLIYSIIVSWKRGLL